MDGIVICTRRGLLYGRRYIWYGMDCLTIEGNLSLGEQQLAIRDAFAEVHARSVRAALAA